MILGCTSETHRRASELSLAGHDRASLHGAIAHWPLAEASCELEFTPLVRSSTPLVTSLSESGRPGVSTPQHLPSVGFLNPSTVYSSEQRACSISYRHHLWGSKSRNSFTRVQSASSTGRIRRTTPISCAPRVDELSDRGHSWSVSRVLRRRRAHQPCLLRCDSADMSLTNFHANRDAGSVGPSADQTKHTRS